MARHNLADDPFAKIFRRSRIQRALNAACALASTPPTDQDDLLLVVGNIAVVDSLTLVLAEPPASHGRGLPVQVARVAP